MSIEVPSSLSLVEINGSPFEVGVALGRHGRDIVHRHLIRTHGWASVIAFAGHERIVAARALVEAHFPRYFEELHGLAKGLELPFDEVFAWNCRGDIRAIAPDGCTTVICPARGSRWLITRRRSGLRPGCAIVRIASAGGRAFFGFVYPGSLPGAYIRSSTMPARHGRQQYPLASNRDRNAAHGPLPRRARLRHGPRGTRHAAQFAARRRLPYFLAQPGKSGA